MISQKTIYYIVLGLFTTAVLGSILNSFLNYEEVSLTFVKLGYPIYLIHLLGLFQTIGLLLIWFNKSHWSLEWAFAGFFMNYTLGAISHLVIKDGNGASAVICIILLFITYVQSKKIRDSNNRLAEFGKPKYI
ncbi:DoxX family protein [Maribacter arcticus]|uniref:DoxX-like family protein n=1 Tax=Maribacter arcticus TaxID=561365 RepID=A0A1T5EDC2_9FLAO|nr:DoxX family protein [Maribacter arcticus]SKB81859.1 DoxX-like family protein [Maribacter arcticus]|tara:strand:+ start:4132 stop:4530 length:399 start_codon:yes stop_codon:yes gene_type:complete